MSEYEELIGSKFKIWLKTGVVNLNLLFIPCLHLKRKCTLVVVTNWCVLFFGKQLNSYVVINLICFFSDLDDEFC